MRPNASMVGCRVAIAGVDEVLAIFILLVEGIRM